MKKIYSLKEAYIWFLEHHEGNIICIKNGKEKEISCYPKAKDFFKNRS